MLVQMVIMTVAVVQIIDPATPMTPGLMIAAVLILGRALQPIEAGVGQARPMIEAYQAYRQIEAVLQEAQARLRSEEHTSELQSLMRISYAVFCLKKKKQH